MNYLSFFYISEKYLQFRKEKKYLLEKILAHPVQETGSIYCGIVFQSCIPQRYVDSLERNWKHSVCIRIKNFAYL